MNEMDNPQFTPTTVAPSAPPPPPEVKVRTMKSDLASMAQSGGGMPRFQTVSIVGLGNDGSAIQIKKPNKALAFLIILAAIVVVAVVAYFVFAKGLLTLHL